MLMCCKDNEKINLMNMFAEKKFVCLHDNKAENLIKISNVQGQVDQTRLAG